MNNSITLILVVVCACMFALVSIAHWYQYIGPAKTRRKFKHLQFSYGTYVYVTACLGALATSCYFLSKGGEQDSVEYAYLVTSAAILSFVLWGICIWRRYPCTDSLTFPEYIKQVQKVSPDGFVSYNLVNEDGFVGIESSGIIDFKPSVMYFDADSNDEEVNTARVFSPNLVCVDQISARGLYFHLIRYLADCGVVCTEKYNEGTGEYLLFTGNNLYSVYSISDSKVRVYWTPREKEH